MPAKNTPKHKKPTPYAGGTPRGPERWMRAAHNAFTRPNTQAAKLFMTRVSNAHRLREKFGDGGPVVFFEYTTAWDLDEGVVVLDQVKHERRYVVCSHYCAAMQVQLDFGVKTYDDLEFFLTYDFRTNSLANIKDKLVRKVRCQCCGTDIKP